MNSDQQEFIHKIKGYLDSGAADLKPGTLYRLQQARARAMAGVAPAQTVTQEARALALVGQPGSGAFGGSFWRSPRLWLGIVLIVAIGLGVQEWQAKQQAIQFADIDAQILSSDLPIDAYLDKGFQAWLTRQER